MRRRLTYVTISIVIWGMGAYGIERHLENILLKPAGDQQFIFTTPGGGFDFVFRLCLYAGIAASIPVIVYQLLRYVQPLIRQGNMRIIAWSSVASGFLAVVGVLFGYFYGLPSSMDFLLNKGVSSSHIEALISIQSYMSFVMMYLLGAALLFQVPLVMITINRIRPLQIGKLMGFQRWFIVISAIIGAVINPSPNIKDQLILTIPMILMYQLGIIVVWLTNRRHHKPKKVVALAEKDSETQQQRLERLKTARPVVIQPTRTTQPIPQPQPSPMKPAVAAAKAPLKPPMPQPQRTVPPQLPPRPRPYLDQFKRRNYSTLS